MRCTTASSTAIRRICKVEAAAIVGSACHMMIAVSDPKTVAVDHDMRLRAVYTKHEGMRFAAFLTGLTVPLIGVMWGWSGS